MKATPRPKEIPPSEVTAVQFVPSGLVTIIEPLFEQVATQSPAPVPSWPYAICCPVPEFARVPTGTSVHVVPVGLVVILLTPPTATHNPAPAPFLPYAASRGLKLAVMLAADHVVPLLLVAIDEPNPQATHNPLLYVTPSPCVMPPSVPPCAATDVQLVPFVLVAIIEPVPTATHNPLPYATPTTDPVRPPSKPLETDVHVVPFGLVTIIEPEPTATQSPLPAPSLPYATRYPSVRLPDESADVHVVPFELVAITEPSPTATQSPTPEASLP